MTTRLHLPDVFRFAKALNPAKLANAGKVLGSYYYSRSAGKPTLRGYPLTVSIEPTTSCNLRCPQCPSGLRSFTRDTGMIERALFERTVDELEQHLIYLYLYFQGEPYLHPQFTEMVEYASRKNIYTVTSTNAHFLDEENARKTVESGLARLIVSVDGATQESYEKYRIGGNLEKVLNGVKTLAGWKRKLKASSPHVVFQMVVFSHNENEIAALHQIANECGADEVQLKTAQIYDYENGSELIPANEKYARYRASLTPAPSPPRRGRGVQTASHFKNDTEKNNKLKTLTQNGFYQIKNPLLNHCWKMWHSCVVTWDGKVAPCCFDKDATHIMGDLKQQSFRDIWNGDAYREFRARLFRSRKEIDICSNCSEGTKVWI